MSINNDNKKDLIISTALRRFAHYGFSKTGMNEIADDLKMTKANLYYYYPDKISLIVDVILHLTSEFRLKEAELVNNWDGSILDLLLTIIELHNSTLKKYYMLHVNENLEWIKGDSLRNVLKEIHDDEVEFTEGVLRMGVDKGEFEIADLKETAEIFVAIIKSLGLVGIISDVISGIPNNENIDKVCQKQKSALLLIYNGLKK